VTPQRYVSLVCHHAVVFSGVEKARNLMVGAANCRSAKARALRRGADERRVDAAGIASRLWQYAASVRGRQDCDDAVFK
jgi:hypothetical protein